MHNDTLTLPTADSDMEFMSVYIDVTTWEDIDDLYDEDREALGEFEVRVPRHLPPRIAAATALGTYHSEIPIKYMGSFEFEVFDEHGYAIKPDYEVDGYALAEEHQAYLVD